MKLRYVAAAMCVALPVVAGVALAQQQGGRGPALSEAPLTGDGVAAPAAFPLQAAKGVDSGAKARPLPGGVNTGAFNKNTWKFGPRSNPPAGGSQIWSPVKRKMLAGEKVYSATINGHGTPEQYCAQATSPTYDFIWTEMQHSPGTWQNVAQMWTTCPGLMGIGEGKAHAMAGTRISSTVEMEVQHATDMGAMVIVIPTIDSAAEAAEGVKWTYFPPMGRRSAGSNVAGQQIWWGAVPGGYRATYNDNVTLILMIETLEGISEADQIAATKGVTGVFAASSDLGNFSGYGQGDPDYERLINIVHDATLKAKVRLCGPSAWNDRNDFTCFQGGPPAPGGRGAGGRGRGGRGPAADAAPAPAQ
jgi:2-keto-3-deoxy-L-rhamnonate aldolase RhmA